MLIHRDPAVRRQAARTLAAIGTDSFTSGARVDALTRHLNDRDPEVVEALLLALAFIGPNAKRAIPKVLETAKHSDPRVRRAAIGFFIVFLPENKGLMPTLIAALDDPDVGTDAKKSGYGSVSMVALTALSRYGPEATQVVPKLIQMVKDKKHDDLYEKFILNTLVRVKPDDPFTMKLIREWLRQKDSAAHLQKAIGLVPRGLHGKPAVPEIVAALQRRPFADLDLEQRIKLSLLDALLRIGPDAKESLSAVRMLLNSADILVRQRAEKTIKAIERER
jgi:HEAT repeat protein